MHNNLYIFTDTLLSVQTTSSKFLSSGEVAEQMIYFLSNLSIHSRKGTQFTVHILHSNNIVQTFVDFLLARYLHNSASLLPTIKFLKMPG